MKIETEWTCLRSECPHSCNANNNNSFVHVALRFTCTTYKLLKLPKLSKSSLLMCQMSMHICMFM